MATTRQSPPVVRTAARSTALNTVHVIVALPAEARCVVDVVGVTVHCAGVGPRRATDAAEAAVRNGAKALASCGLAGGLGAGLEPGALIVPRRVIDGRTGKTLDTDPPWRDALAACLDEAHDGTLVSTACAAGTTAAKADLHARFGADAVDMESAAVAAVARRHRLPYVALRVIVDPADTSLPGSALVALDAATGRVRPLKLATSLVRHPGDVAALLKLAPCNRLALRRLRAACQRLQSSWSPP